MIDRFGRGLFVSSAVVAMVAATPAMAQTRSFDVPAQSAETGIAALGRQADIQIVAARKFTKGKQTKAVRGSMTVEAALRQLLEGTGLTFRSTGAQTYMVVQGGNADATPARAEAPAVTTQAFANASTIVDARTGAALKGALVEIVETGEKTSTGELGQFRFAGKTGSFNLRISYLGYPEYQQYVELKDGRATTGILLSDGSATDEIVVTAYQSARAQAINQERTSENTSTVVSSDLLGQFDGNTISDALRRTPGVAFEVDTRTGDGTNVIVRGLPSSFNTVTLNGLRLPVGDGFSRSPSLGNILADSVSSITINKTLLPNQDGTGTGALIEIETKGPLDRPSRYFNISGDKATSSKDFLDEENLAGTASFRFGADKNFGLSASVQYRKRNVANVSLNSSLQYPRYLPLIDDGRPVLDTFSIDPRRLFPFEEGVSEIYQGDTQISQSESSTENLAIGLSAEWKIGSHTNLKLDYNRSRLRQTNFGRSISLSPLSGYQLLPIDELGGEERYARVWEDYIFPGGVMLVTHGVTYEPAVTSKTQTLSFQGETNLGQLELNYRAGIADGTNASRDPFFAGFSPLSFFLTFDRANLSDEVLRQVVNGQVISPFPVANDRNVSLPGFNESGFAILNDSSLFYSSSAGAGADRSRNERYTGAFSAKYNFRDSILKYVEAGFFYEKSEVTIRGLPVDTYSFDSASLADLGLNFSDGLLGRVGLPDQIAAVSRADFIDFYNRLRAGTIPGAVTTRVDPVVFDGFRGTREETIAGYLQANIEIGKLQLVGGARLERVNTLAGGLQGSIIFLADGNVDLDWLAANPQTPAIFSGSDTTLLPRFQANFRFAENLILRGGFYQTISRPNISQLAGNYSLTLDQRPFFGAAGNQPGLFINLPNPGLKAAVTNNFDLSLEWYSSSIGVVKAGIFFKPTKNPFFSNTDVRGLSVPDGVELPDDPRFSDPNLFIQVTQPGNANYTTKYWGFEVSAERRFDFLPGLLSAFGTYANYTYADGKREVNTPFAFAPDGLITRVLPYATSPKHSGTAALTFSRHGLDASLAYTYQSRYLQDFNDFGLNPYREAISSLDFKASYQTKLRGADARIFFEASNLLRGTSDPNTRSSVGGALGVPKTVTGADYIGGRVFRGGLSVSF